jgi:single stranded DNA-binding protein
MQQVQIAGNVGRDPESRQVGGGTVFNFTVAVNKSKKKPDGSWDKKTNWWTVDCWSQQVPYGVKKGAFVVVSGEFELGFDKEDKVIMNNQGMPMLKVRTDQYRVVVHREKNTTGEGYSPSGSTGAPESEDASVAPLVAPDGNLDELPF